MIYCCAFLLESGKNPAQLLPQILISGAEQEKAEEFSRIFLRAL